MTIGPDAAPPPRGAAVPPAPVDVELSDDTARVVVRGDLDATTSEDIVGTVVTALGDRPLSTLVVDMSGAGFVDSTGLGSLVRLRLEAGRLGAQTSLVGLDQRLAKLLRLTGLDRDFFAS